MKSRKYPIYNSLAYRLISLADFVLKGILPKSSHVIIPPKKLLISNGAHLGDVILTTALLPALKVAYPDIKIGMLTGSWSQSVVRNHPLIKWTHCVDHWKIDRSKTRQYLKTRKSTLKEIKSVGYDTAIDCCFHFPNFAPLLWQAKIPIRIGFESAGLSPFLTHTKPWRADENISAVHAYYSLLKLFPNINPNLLQPTLCLSPKKVRDPYLVVHIGSGDQRKQWPIENWIELSKKLHDDGYKLIFTGRGELEFTQIEMIRTQIPAIKNVCNTLNWNEFVETIQNAKLLIGVDTSAGHVASATHTPAVLLFTSIHPPNIWRPFHQDIHVITKQMPCSPCFIGCKSMKCINSIPVATVYERVKALLN